MKKIISVILCAVMLLSAVTYSSAATCSHSYSSSRQEATCVNRTRTVYTCSKCGYYYFADVTPYTRPSEFHMILDGSRDGNTLTVKVTMGKNPGLWASRLTLNYNSSALKPVSMKAGTIWGSNASVTLNEESQYIRFYAQNSELGDNTSNGTVFTVTFDILDIMDNWGLELTYSKRDNVSYSNGAQVFTYINAVTMGYADHAYGEGVVIKSPTVDSYGQMKYTCTICPKTKTEQIDKLIPYVSGDIDGDGEATLLDLFSLKLFVKQKDIPTDLEASAADIDGDGEITMIDSFELKYRVATGEWR